MTDDRPPNELDGTPESWDAYKTGYAEGFETATTTSNQAREQDQARMSIEEWERKHYARSGPPDRPTSRTEERILNSIWPKADEYDEQTALASVIWSYQPPSLTTPISGPQSIALAAAVIKAGWVNLEKFRHDITNALGMCLVHEPGEIPTPGYDRGIVDAMDAVNGTLWTGSGALDCRAANRDKS